MTRKVYKYEIQPDGSSFQVAGMKPLYVAGVGERLYLWAEVEVEGIEQPHLFFAFPTGHMAIPEGAIYIGTALMHDGQLVWHVYEIPVEKGLTE